METCYVPGTGVVPAGQQDGQDHKNKEGRGAEEANGARRDHSETPDQGQMLQPILNLTHPESSFSIKEIYICLNNMFSLLKIWQLT